MQCWKCGAEVDGNFCTVCGCKLAERKAPQTTIGKALRYACDKFGTEKILSDPQLLAECSKDLLYDEPVICQQIKQVMLAGFGSELLETLRKNRTIDKANTQNLQKKISSITGLPESDAHSLLEGFLDMVGIDLLENQPAPSINPDARKGSAPKQNIENKATPVPPVRSITTTPPPSAPAEGNNKSKVGAVLAIAATLILFVACVLPGLLENKAGSSTSTVPTNTPKTVLNGEKKANSTKANAENSRVFKLNSGLSNNRGMVTISWSDSANNSPYTVAFQCVDGYGISQPSYWAGGDKANSTTTLKSFTFNNLVPGRTYSIRVTDCSNHTITGTYTIPAASSFVDGKLSASSIKVTLQPRSKTYGTDAAKAGTIKALKATDIVNNRSTKEYGFRYEIKYPQLAYSRTYNTQVAVIAPNGFTECEVYDTYDYGSNYDTRYWYLLGSWTFQRIYEYNSIVPTGNWTVELYWDGMLVNRSTIKVQ